jgi:LacI family transcriptional regulator
MPQRQKSRTITLKDVARRAGVSYQTVSRAVNGHADISADTRSKILRIAERLGYSPNRLAGSLRTNQSKVIGLVVSDIENIFFAEAASGVEAEARSHGYSVLLANSGEDNLREREAVRSLVERRVDGLILAPAQGDHSYLQTALPKRFPLVTINRKIEFTGCGAIVIENENAARLAVEYLITRGHQKIGAIVASAELSTSRERLVGFRSAMERAQLPLRREWITTGTIRPDGARAAAIRILTQPERPTAMMTSSHRISEGVLVAMKELGLKLGRDIDIVGFDHLRWSALLDPPMAVIEQPTRHIGREATHMLIKMINGTAGPSVVTLPAKLITHMESELQISA